MNTLEEIWQFLLNDEYREVLTWISGGIASIAAGAWLVISVKAGKNRNASHEPVTKNQRIIARHGGMAAGRDIRIGLRGLNLVLFVVIMASLVVIVATRFGERIVDVISNEDAGIPEFNLSLYCGEPGDPRAHWAYLREAEVIANFVNFLDEFNGSEVYVSVKIDKACNSCECVRESIKLDSAVESPYDIIREYPPKFIGFEENNVRENPEYQLSESSVLGEVFFDHRSIDERESIFRLDTPRMWVEGYEIFAILPEHWAYTYSIFLPRESHLSSGQYRSGEYGSALSYDGIFIARSYDGTGGGARHLDPTVISDENNKKLMCIRDGRKRTAVSKIFEGC